ncbi:Transposon Ty3-G Gag-Pol polyprotein [Labeo rohita]|uniref:ribonuclease H n=1 Tax=Labeo rohita TaxID=84645 RepID=A0ABQ8LB18_LABRO|nr:Transposon Ty3-G Gag-Pol polyprotein [Labeo rohita]
MSGHPTRGLWSGHPARGLWSGPLRAGPTGEGHGPPHSSMPVSPLCPREISLPTLPVLQGASVWKLLPNVSAWVLRTVDGVFPTVVSPEQGLVMEQEVETLLRKEAIEVVPPHDRESGFYSRYFIVPKKDGGLRPILDLRLRNRSVMRLKFKMLTVNQVVSQIRSEDWFVTIDLKDAYFHVSILPQHRKFLRFAFTGEAYQYRVLPFGLALSPRTFTKCVDAALAQLRLRGIRMLNYINDWLILAQSEHMAVQHRDVVLAHLKELELRLNAKKSVVSPLQRTTYLGVVWDSTTMQARLSPSRIESILTAVARVKEGRSLTVKQFQRLLGLIAAASNVIPFGLLYMRPLQWWLKTKGFSPRGNPFCMIKVTRQCLRALDMWKKPWFLSQGLVLGAPCRRVMLATDASLTGWGAVMSGHPARGLWSSRHLTWHINCLEMLAVFRALKHFLPDLIGHHVLVRTDSTAVVYYINHQGGLRLRPLYKLAHQILVWSQDKLLSLRAVHVPRHLNMGADILSRQGLRPGEWMLHPKVAKQIWRVFGQAQVDLFATKENAQCHHWCSLTYPAPLGLDAMVQMWPRLRLYAFPLIALLPGVLERDRFSTGLAHSILKVYVAAISAYHAPLGGSSVAVLFHTRQGFEVWWRGHLIPIAFSTHLEFLKGNVSGNETLRLGPYFRHPCSACFSIQKLPAACTARAFKLPGPYVTPPVMSRFSIGLYAHVFQIAFHSVFDAASRSLGEPWLHT